MVNPDRHHPVWLAAGVLGACTLLVGGALSVDAAPRHGSTVETLSVDHIRPGMKGYAVTVFKGNEPERFPIRVVDVVRDYLPKQDAILFDSPDPRLQHTGIVGGMSGSPIYIDGKLVGALAYGYRFGKDPLGGITPIANMLDVAALPFRPEVLPSRPRTQRRGSQAWADAMLGLDDSPLPPRLRPDDLRPAAGLSPLGVPMAVGGLGPAATQMLVDAFGFAPARGGGAKAPSSAKRPWKMGDAVSVVLVDGDNGVAPNGTISWIDPSSGQMLAFGHPLFGDGPSNLPFADAHVHTIVASLDRSVKLSSHGNIQGAMIQDRQAAISLRRGLDAPMIPISTRVVGPEPDLPPRVYDNRIALGLGITPNLVAVLIADAVEEAGRDATEVVAHIRHDFDIVTSRGPRKLTIEDQAFFPEGIEPRLLARSRGVAVANILLDNDFEVAEIRGIQQEARVEYGAALESIMEVRLPRGEVRAGDVVELTAVLRPFKGEERKVRIPLRIPDDAGGEEIQIEIAGGDESLPYRPIPSSLDDLLDTLEQFYSSRSLVVSIYRQEEGLSTRHGLLPSLPGSVLETLTTAGTTRDTLRLKQLARRVIDMPTIIEGEHSFKIDVLPRRTFSSP